MGIQEGSNQMSVMTRIAAGGLAAATAAGLAFASWSAAAPAASANLATASAPALTSAERSDLTVTREEERLAHDLYTVFAEKYQVATFTRIAASEQRHFDAVGVLLARYQVSDPSAGSKAAAYADTTLQNLYDTWKASGLKSVTDAYQVGVALEKRDIADLQRMQKDTTNADLDRLYSNLETGSDHHLAAFTAAANGTPLPMGNGPRSGAAGNAGPGMHNGTGTRQGQHQGSGHGLRDGSCMSS
jgi:hypothetical protein